MKFNNFFKHNTASNRLRFVIGTARSGTSWISEVLNQGSPDHRFITEPLFHYYPIFNLSKKYDHTASPFMDDINHRHPIVKAYKNIVKENINFAKLFKDKTEHTVKKNPKIFHFCIIKEVHSLLITEALIKYFQSPTVLISRDPIYVTDSHINDQGFKSILWRNEYEYVKNSVFLNYYFKDNKEKIMQLLKRYDIFSNKRMDIIVAECLVIALIKKMFKMISKKYVCVMNVEYSEVCKDPVKIFKKIFQHMNFEFNQNVRDFLIKTQQPKKEEYNPYSIYRNTKIQPNRPYKILNEEEVKILKDILLYTKLL